MSTEHADRKIKDLLTKTHGQSKLAEQAIRTLVERDHVFLLSLVEPYLGGIILHSIERARKGTSLKEPAVAKPPAKTALPKVAAKAKPPAEFSGSAVDGLMKAWAKKFETDAPDSGTSKKVSQNHMDAMQALVKNPGKSKK